MARSLRTVALLLSLLAIAQASQAPRQATCETKTAHKPWQMLTSAEQAAYIEAEVCLMESPSKLNITGSTSRFSDMQYNHIMQTHFVHDNGQFLPWHRYLIAIHGWLMRDECNYSGPIPYWDETLDFNLGDLTASSLFQDDAFGGTGVGRERYIEDGPFANTTLYLQRPGIEPREYRISRTLNARLLRGADQSSLDACFQITSYAAAWECWGGMPHGAGHSAVGGLHVDPFLSPGDPIFYLHHGWLDAMWWKWQTLDLPARLTDMGGRKIPSEMFLRMLGVEAPGPEWTDYDGSEGNTTTLNHVLYVNDIYPNVTVAEVMDVGGTVICADYVFSDSFSVTRLMSLDGMITPTTIPSQ